jgi:hypothetical protein
MISKYYIEDFFNESDRGPKFVGVNLSTTFLIRTKCKFCATGPVHYFTGKTTIKWLSPHKAKGNYKFYFKFIKRVNYDYYLDEAPKKYTSMSPFTHTPAYKGYNPALHKKRGVSAINDFVEYLCCDCGRSKWVFSQKATKQRPEIVNRKAKNNYPVKFEDWS